MIGAEAQGLIFGMGGLVVTAISTALGLYFTARARSAPLREHLFERQLDLVHRVLRAFGRARPYLQLLTVDEYRDRAEADLSRVARRLSTYSDEAAALLPTELFAVIKQAGGVLFEALSAHEEGRDTGPLRLRFLALSTKAALMCREALGVDELSEETIGLFTSEKNLARLAELDLEPLAREAVAKDRPM